MTTALSNGHLPTAAQDDALAAVFGQIDAAAADPLFSNVSDTDTLKFDPNRKQISLTDLSTKTRLTITDLYSRAKGRKLLIAAPYRTPAADRFIFQDDIDAVLAPKRGSPTLSINGNPVPFQMPVASRPAVSAAPPVTAPLPPEARGWLSPTVKAAIQKTLSLAEGGHYTASEALFLIGQIIGK